jgi:hypothetical protein
MAKTNEADTTKGKDSAPKDLTPAQAAEKKMRFDQRSRNLKRKMEIIAKDEKVEILVRKRVKTDDGFETVEEKKKVSMYSGPKVESGKKPMTQREINLANKPAAIKQAAEIAKDLKEQDEARKRLAKANA